MAIVFYDGECGLCQRLIQFLYFADKRKILSFAPLNGVTFKEIYGQELASLTTVKLYHDQKTFEKSTAVLKLCLLLGGFYKIFYLFIIVPAFIRDFIYDQIASRRKVRSSCPYFAKDNRFLN